MVVNSFSCAAQQLKNVVNVKFLERCFNEKIDGEMGNVVDRVEDRIQNAISTAIHSIITSKMELAFRSIIAPSGRDSTSVMASSKRGENIGITSLFENVSERNNTLHGLNTNDDTRNKIPDKISELSVPGTRSDRQPQTHHSFSVGLFTFRVQRHSSVELSLVLQPKTFEYISPGSLVPRKSISSKNKGCRGFNRYGEYIL